MAVDAEVEVALDSRVLAWKDVTTRRMFGGVAYMVRGKMFAALMEGAVAMKLPDELRIRALPQDGVSLFRPIGGQFGQWVQFEILMEDDVPAVIQWLESAFEYVASLHKKGKRSPEA